MVYVLATIASALVITNILLYIYACTNLGMMQRYFHAHKHADLENLSKRSILAVETTIPIQVLAFILWYMVSNG